jgi:hypothetical protein
LAFDFDFFARFFAMIVLPIVATQVPVRSAEPAENASLMPLPYPLRTPLRQPAPPRR